MSVLASAQIILQLKSIPDWSKRGPLLTHTFEFKDFDQSLAFVNRIATKARKLNHHPDIDIRFNKVSLALTSHEEGGLTENDFTLAAQADKVAAKISHT
jgi:4a-hydroxytetrahydrobiopterin dehydratase